MTLIEIGVNINYVAMQRLAKASAAVNESDVHKEAKLEQQATRNIKHIRAYLNALEKGCDADELRRYFCVDAMQIELPNRLNAQGGASDLATLLARAEQGKKILRSQHYAILSELAQGDLVAVEATWTATLAVPIAGLDAGDIMTAHFAMFFEMRDGAIRVQRNYDCFEPW